MQVGPSNSARPLVPPPAAPAAVPDPAPEPSAPAQADAPGSSEAEAHTTELSTEERAAVAELSARDAEVRAHEAAHASAGGGLAGSPSYSYQTGPDGKQYAVGGEVSIDTSGGATPQETIARMRQVRAAALAPANPSGQDQAVAASASRREAAAREEMAKVAAEASGPPAAHEHDGSVCPFCNTAAQRYKAVAEAKATAPSSQHAVRAEPV